MSKVLQDLANLAKTIREKETDPEELKDMEKFLEEKIGAFPQYFSSVIIMETHMTILRAMYDREDYIDRVQNMDQNRRISHQMAAYAINGINRVCDMYGVDHIFKFPEKENDELKPEASFHGDPISERLAKDDRELAADAVYNFCKEVFLDAKSREIYNVHEVETREQRDQELYEIGKTHGTFNKEITIDELIDKAREECAKDSSSYNKNAQFDNLEIWDNTNYNNQLNDILFIERRLHGAKINQ